MIQRIQSLYLLLVVIGCICMFFFPIANYADYQFTLMGAKQIALEPLHSLVINTIPLIVITAAIVLLSAIIIFEYKNRPRQSKHIRILILINVVLIVVIFFYSDIIEKKINNASNYSVSAVIPLITLVLSFLAGRGIKKDEELIKSSDRLR